MTARLAHQDPADVVAYKRAGWWDELTVGDYVGRWARERPEDVAFVIGDERLLWQQYDERATDLASALVAAGLPRGARVAVLLPDGAAVHVAFVAAERAGLTAVGIGYRAGTAEVAHLLTRTDAAAIVRLDTDVDRLPAGVEIGDVIVGRDGQPSASAPPVPSSDLAERALGADELFLVNSTSGTTGLPKCVMHNQNRWMFFHQLASAAGRFTAHDVFFSALPAPFGFGLWTSHVTPAVLGCTTVVQERFDAADALRAIERERVSVLACVSTQFLMMLNVPELERYDLSSLRCMFTGGEAVPPDRAARFEDVTGARVLQFYGSNETGALSRTTMDDDRAHRLGSAGRIIPEMHVRLLDDDGHDIFAAGVPGHPVCRGPATCFGYLDDALANEELFTPDGWMRIGDVCEIDADGYLRVVGRTSDIIIRGGKNLSAPAIEAAVAEHPAIAIAAVVPMPDEVFGERVCLYAELRPGVSLTLEELTSHLEGRGVSREWFPERLVVLDALPRASGGKVAKGTLRDRRGT
ncbi:MAG TPA: class I adenylate-forming enzyme family protein [Acidimicrobiia bacterium]|nr:class I adenylate-forming enzyme family protein [Acidimicrobiia bacterium]